MTAPDQIQRWMISSATLSIAFLIAMGIFA
jgi:hypothetical protein